MEILDLIFGYQKKTLKRFFKTRRSAKIITIALFGAVFTAVAAGIYVFFVHGFSFINHDPFFREALTLYVYELYLLFIGLLVMVSALITAIFALFRSRQDSWILSSPRYDLALYAIFYRALIGSLWPLLIIMLPALLAVKTVYGLGLAAILINMAALILYTVMLVCLVFLVILAIGRCLLYLSRARYGSFLKLKWLIAIIFILMAVLTGAVWRHSLNRDLIVMFRAQDLGIIQADTGVIDGNFRIFPSHLAAKGLYYWQTGKTLSALSLFLFLAGLAALTAFILNLARAWFLPIWQKMQEGAYSAQSQSVVKARKKSGFSFPPRPVGALFKKELLVSARNPRTMLWAVFLILIWLMQTGLNIVLSRNMIRYDLKFETFPVMVQTLQFMTAAYFISAFVLRFVFPALSTERKTAWILLCAPLSFRQVFWAKYVFYAPLLIVLGLAIGYLNLLTLGLALTSLLSTLALLVATLLFIITFGLALGALYPNFETDDPSSLSTTLPGLGFILGSIIYGALGGAVLFAALVSGSWLLPFIFLAATALLIIILLILSPRALTHIDYIKSSN